MHKHPQSNSIWRTKYEGFKKDNFFAHIELIPARIAIIPLENRPHSLTIHSRIPKRFSNEHRTLSHRGEA